MFYDGWYKTLRKSTSCDSSSIPSNTYHQESRENGSLEQDSSEINYALEGLFSTYNLNEITLKDKGSYKKGFEADEFGDLGGEDLADDTVADTGGDDGGFNDLGGDDMGDDDMGDDSAFDDLGGDDDGGLVTSEMILVLTLMKTEMKRKLKIKRYLVKKH